MALIKISGVELPTPAVFDVGIMDINKVDRNARGDMIGERITTKRKIELSWRILTREQISQILSLVSPLFFQVQYVDPKDNSLRIGEFYVGDRSCPMMSFVNSVPKYKDVKFNLVER